MVAPLQIVYTPAMRTPAKDSTAVATKGDSAVYLTPSGELALDV